ncbi:MAG: DUF192 domain-containing protein [Nanoarchaeota archaeon]|nr:DUF192 domain-containing protein [DPANN group archaeon]MBL7116927.1 DUF192 domain-containing protein [Nanoarchaeota archaeon]
MGKKIILLLIILLLYGCSEKTKFEYETGEVVLGDITVNVEIADTYDKVMFGLMEREKLGEFEGMLFIFSDEEPRTFWMKNTLIPLDIIFINSDFEIVKIQHAVPCEEDPCELYPSEEPAKFVVEVNEGFSEEHGVDKGMKAEINY